MNKELLLSWLIRDAEEFGDDYENCREDVRLEEALYELNNRRPIELPPSLPKTLDRMISTLRRHFNDNVSFISLVLSHHFPDRFLFYRVSKLEAEIFEGLELFPEIVPEFELPFSRVGRTGFNRYLQLNEALLDFARACWPESKDLQGRIHCFLYAGLGSLFVEKSDYNRYWVMATREDYFDDLDTEDQTVWSGRKEMKQGDLVFMYRTAPRSAVTDIYRARDEPWFDPYGAWDGFWVELERVCSIDDIPFSLMRQDPVLSKWGTIRKQFTGTVTEPVPHSAYNRLLEPIPESTRRRYGLEPEPLAPSGRSGDFSSEAEFEECVIAPLLRRWSLRYQPQHPCRFRFGIQEHRGRVDFFVSDERGPLTLFEDKLRILNDQDLMLAVDQAKSYALMVGLPSFVVAAPEGMWVYSLDRNQETLEQKLSGDELQTRDEEILSLLLRLRP